MAIDESRPERLDGTTAERVSLSRWVNERLPSCQEILTDHDVARLTRRPQWVLAALTLLGRFPSKQRFHGRRIGWRRHEVLLWLGNDEGRVGAATLTRFSPEPQQRELQLRHPPCRRSRSHRSRCSPGRREHLERLRMRQIFCPDRSGESDSEFPDPRTLTSDDASGTP